MKKLWSVMLLLSLFGACIVLVGYTKDTVFPSEKPFSISHISAGSPDGWETVIISHISAGSLEDWLESV